MKRRCLAVIFVLCLVLAACGGNKTKSIRYVIPDFSSVLSKSDLVTSSDSDTSIDQRYTNGTKEKYDKVVEICMSSGFDHDLRNVEFRDDFWRYDAYDADENYYIEVFWEDNEITIFLNTVEKTE